MLILLQNQINYLPYIELTTENKEDQMQKACFKISCKYLCNHVHTHSYLRKLSPKELILEEERLCLQPCPNCASKPFSEWNSKVVSKRGGYRFGSGRPTSLGQGKTTTIRIPLKYKEQVINYVKTLAKTDSEDTAKD